MFITVLLFILGFIFLVKGADLLVDGSSSIAKKYGISNLVIGLTIVAFGTSFPELVVSAFASFNGSTGVALGNIVGSNISNTLLILGASAIIRPLLVKKNTINKEIPFSLLAVFAVFLLVNDVMIDGGMHNLLGRADGVVLILFFCIFVYYTFGISKVETGVVEKMKEEKIDEHNFLASLGMILLGLVGLYFGGRWIVDGAIEFASVFGVSESLIGLTIVAIGTSLPELAASGMAAYRGHTDMAVGNVVGSNIFNIFWVLGVSASIRAIPYESILNVDFMILFSATILLLILIYFGKKHVLDKREGAILVFLYVIYLLFLVIRG